MSASRSPSLARVGVEVVTLLVVALVVSLVAGVAFVVPALVLGYGIDTTGVLLGSTAAGQLAFLAVGYAYTRYRDVEVPVRRPSKRDLLFAGGGVVAALALAIALSLALTALNLVPDSVIGEVAATDPAFLLGLAVLSVLIVAPAEELLFRGAIQGRLRQRVGPAGAVVGAALVFGSVHLANYTGAFAPIVAGALLIAAVGCVFGVLYEYTENLVVPVAAHATYNVVLLVTSYLAA